MGGFFMLHGNVTQTVRIPLHRDVQVPRSPGTTYRDVLVLREAMDGWSNWARAATHNNPTRTPTIITSIYLLKHIINKHTYHTVLYI